MSTNYSSLDEVWGEAYNPSQKSKKEKKKKVHDPICELYEMGNNGGYNENDLLSYANNYFEKYDKTPYNRTMNGSVVGSETNVMPQMPQMPNVPQMPQNTQMPQQYQRERPVREVAVSDARHIYDVSDNDDVSDVGHAEQHVMQRVLPKQTTREVINKKQNKETFKPLRYFDDEDDESETTTGFAFIDLLLYIISGIILIFMMEQFVKIGLLLQ